MGMKCPHCFGDGYLCQHCYGAGEIPTRSKKKLNYTPAWMNIIGKSKRSKKGPGKPIPTPNSISEALEECINNWGMVVYVGP